MPSADIREWSRYFRFDGEGALGSVAALHARFVAHRYPRHLHDFMVVGLVESGAQAYDYRGARHVTPAGRIFLVNPDEPHTGEAASPGGYVYRTLYLPVTLLARVADELGHHGGAPSFSAATLDDSDLAGRLSRLHACIAGRGSRTERESRLWETLACLIAHHADGRPPVRSPGRERAAVRAAREYMESNFDDDVRLATLADLVGLSPYYFARAFARAVGLPPHAYLESVRMRKARELLDRGLALSDAALAVGYSDQSHFTRRFKSFVGVTPGRYVRDGKIRQDSPGRR